MAGTLILALIGGTNPDPDPDPDPDADPDPEPRPEHSAYCDEDAAGL